MKNKNQKAILFLFFILLLAGFFGFGNKTAADSECPDHLLISKINYFDNNDWIEIYNPTAQDIDLAQNKFRIERATASGGDPTYYIAIGTADHGDYPGETIVRAGESYLIADADADAEVRDSADAIIKSSRNFTLTDDNVVYLTTGAVGAPQGSKNNDSDIIDYVGYGNAKQYEGSGPAAIDLGTFTLQRVESFCGFQDTDDNSADFFENNPESEPITDPKPENKLESDGNTEDINYSIRINDFFPNPKGDEKLGEYIEIYNGEDFEIDLSGWILRDASTVKSKTVSKKGYVFPADTVIKSGKYLVLYRPVFDFALNNSGAETVSLLSSAGEEISSVSYTESREGFSYGFDGENWRWSKFLTPGKENKFNSPPKISVKKIKEAFENIPVDFEAAVKTKNKKEMKYAWDFGDGKKSYLLTPTHTYQKSGKYTVTFTADDEGEKFSRSFSLKVRRFPKLDVEIIRLLPNPFGKDIGNEWIEIKNNSRRKVNLKGWKIATGWDTLINHAISEDFIIPAGESRELSRENAFFYLNNTKAKIELRYPNGKNAFALSYKKDKIADDEIYVRVNGQWQWISPEDTDEEEAVETIDQDNEEQESESPLSQNNPAAEKENDAVFPEKIKNSAPEYSKSLASSIQETKKEKRVLLLAYGTTIAPSDNLLKIQKKILTDNTLDETASGYLFTGQSLPEKHWAVKLINNLTIHDNFLFK